MQPLGLPSLVKSSGINNRKTMPLLKINTEKKLTKIIARPVDLERDIQRLIENNLPESLDIDFVASEYSIQGGRMDTLGIDQNGSPVIIEYKKGGNSSIISQAAFYFAWLIDHKEAFEKLVLKQGINRKVNWESPRLICMAENFNFYDYSAIKVLRVRVELLKYRFYGESLLYITPDRPVEVEERLSPKMSDKTSNSNAPISALTLEEFLQSIDGDEKRKLFEDAREILLELSSEIQEKINRTGVTFRTTVNFCQIYPVTHKEISVYYPNSLLSPELIQKFEMKEGKNESVIKLRSEKDLAKFTEIAKLAFEASL